MKDSEIRLLVISKLRRSDIKVSNAAGYVGLARKVLAIRGKKWSGKMLKSIARKILKGFVAEKLGDVMVAAAGKKDFYRSPAWREVRYKALVLHGRACMCCGEMPPKIILHVDHIKPRSKYPQLELELDNLQILCEDCNLGKSNKDDTDFR